MTTSAGTATEEASNGFHRKVALITGGGTGIGRAIAEGWVARGGCAFVIGRREEPLRDLAAAYPETIAYTTGDVGEREDAPRLVSATVEQFGRLDLLVNNAAAMLPNRLQDATDDEIEQSLAVNLGGTLRMSREALPHLERTGGQIINISTTGTLRAVGPWIAYMATKAGIEQATRCLAQDVGPVGIRVNAVSPGPTTTGWSATTDDQRARLAEEIPLRRVGLPSDIARAVLFLASDEATWVTGQVISVGGGHFL